MVNVILDAQMQQQEAAKTLNSVQDQLKELTQSLGDMSSENAELKQQLTAMQQKMAEQSAAPAPQGGMSTGQYQPPRTEYRLNAPSVKTGQVDNATLITRKLISGRKRRRTVSAAPTEMLFLMLLWLKVQMPDASVRGSENLVPMQFKLTGLAHMPGNQRLDVG
jgi:conjugal transfer pilus assembly protein TraB